MNNLVDVIYSGQLLPHAQADDVIDSFARSCSIPQDTSRLIVLGGKEFVIKRKVDRSTAQQYKDKLSQIGMLIHLREDSADQGSDTEAAPKQYGPIEKSEVRQSTYQPEAAPCNPYQGPKGNFSPQPDIDALDVSERWKSRFHLIEKAGGPRLPYFMELAFGERMRVMGNILSFLFWPIYLPVKGLWRPALCYFALGVALGMLLEMAGWERASRAIGYGVSAVAMIRTNTSYYRHKVLGEKFWF